jgi:hypothetical protein
MPDRLDDLRVFDDEEYARRLAHRQFRPVSGGRRPEVLNASRQVNAPLQLLRGWAAGTAGLPGDLEGLARMAMPGVSSEPVLPTSEFYKEWLPGRDASPAGEAFATMGSFAGGVGATKGARGLQKAANVGKRHLGGGDWFEALQAANERERLVNALKGARTPKLEAPTIQSASEPTLDDHIRQLIPAGYAEGGEVEPGENQYPQNFEDWAPYLESLNANAS